MIKVYKVRGRNDKLLYVCGLCGHVFISNSKLVKHLNKSHLRSVTKNDRKLKKMIKIAKLAKDKKNPTEFEKYLLLKMKLNNIKIM